MDRKIFFDHVRKAVFGGRLTAGQVAGMETILEVWGEMRPEAPVDHVANSLAQIKRETGARMAPVRETFAPSDRSAIARLDSAWANGRLPWVKSVYWRDGFFGRGHIQITHRRNYAKLGKRLGVDLVSNPSLALDPTISAKIAIVGMSEGLFTGKKLADYTFSDPRSLRAARRIVNGRDGSDAEVAADHLAFRAALEAAVYAPRVEAPLPPRRPEPEERTPVYEPELLVAKGEAPAPQQDLLASPAHRPPGSRGWIADLLAVFARLVSRRT